MSNVMVAIAKVMHGEGNKVLYGYRMANIDRSTGKSTIQDLSCEVLMDILRLNKRVITNMSFDGHRLIGTQGEINMLPSIDTSGTLIGDNIATIVCEVRNQGFMVITWRGTDLKYLTLKDLLASLRSKTIQGLSNGRVIHKNGLEYVSAASGWFDSITR